VSLLFDAEMLQEETLTFHPGDDRATIFIGTKDLLAFLDGLGVEYRTIDV
jgi:Ala-tRNA(Pro) deacylase